MALLGVLLTAWLFPGCDDSLKGSCGEKEEDIPGGEGPWAGFSAAFTFSTDDNNIDNLVWAEVFRSAGVRFTLFVVPTWLGLPGKLSAQDLRQLHDDGFEVGGHSMTHLRLTQVDDETLIYQMKSCRDTLRDIVGREDYTCRTFAYPYHAHDERVMAAAETLFIATRDGGLSNQGHPDFSEGVATWDSVSPFEVPLQLTMYSLACKNTYSEEDTREAIRSRIDDWKHHSRWVNIYAHRLSGGGWDDCDGAHMAWILEELQADGDVWIAPFADVAEYYRRQGNGGQIR